jgi:hypothetical protein
MGTDSLERALGRIEGQLGAVLAGQAEAKKSLETVELRTAALERWRATVLGGAAVAGGIGGVLARVLMP